ncbi:hypothetical protein EV426DRAFT_306127 [Tirmania nivea]|nr:hypothetical protein EV426DRAFT_306127 [Tirmania nivea]
MPGLQASTTTASTSVTYHGNSSDLWEYAVPLEPDYQQDSASASFKSQNYANNAVNGYNSRQHDNKFRSFSNPLDSAGYLEAAKPHSLHHKDSTISSNQDGDSLFDLYGGKLSTVGAMSTETVNGPNGNLTDEESKWIDSEKLAKIEGKQLEQLKQSEYNTRWIDRDKLERIEIQELEQAGILPSKGARESYNASQGAHQSDDGVTRVRTNSDSSQDERRFYDPNEPDNDLRHPFERVAERGRPMQNIQRNRSSSRIPLYASSPVPVPLHHLERTALLKRQPPSPENGSDDDGSTRTHSRKRSYSAGSTILLTESTPPTTATPAGPKPPATPQTNRVKSNVTSPNRSNSKKGRFSGNSSLAKNKHKSNPQLTPNNRPTSSHQVPEGPPPWSLSTYTPDPKLPPDQQIIPTVARRLQQEQWEKEGVFATVYDTKLRPLKVQDPEEEQEEKEEAKENEADQVKEQVVLITNQNECPVDISEKPALPIVAAPPPKEEKDEKSKIETLKPAKEEDHFTPRTITMINGRNVSQAGQPDAIRMNIPDDKVEKKKKKFACCIIM